MIFYVIGGYLLRLSDRWIIAEFSDMTAVGLYAMAYMLGEGMLLVQLAFVRVMGAVFHGGGVGGTILPRSVSFSRNSDCSSFQFALSCS